jgi:hypothetical protein
LNDHFPLPKEDLGDFLKEELHPMPEHLPILGGAIAVKSTNENEPIPMELYNGIKIKRNPGETLIEVGRYAISKKKGLIEISPKLAQEIAAAVHGSSDGPVRIVIEADEARARLFSKYGFKVLITRKSTYDERIEYILEANSADFLRRAIENDEAYEDFLH